MNRKREAGPIAERDLDELRERGYVLVGGLLAPDEIAELIDETNRLIGTAPAEPGTAVDADGNPVEHPEDYVLPEGPDGVPVLQRINRPMWRSRPLPRGLRQPAHPPRGVPSCTVRTWCRSTSRSSKSWGCSPFCSRVTRSDRRWIDRFQVYQDWFQAC